MQRQYFPPNCISSKFINISLGSLPGSFFPRSQQWLTSMKFLGILYECHFAQTKAFACPLTVTEQCNAMQWQWHRNELKNEIKAYCACLLTKPAWLVSRGLHAVSPYGSNGVLIMALWSCLLVRRPLKGFLFPKGTAVCLHFFLGVAFFFLKKLGIFDLSKEFWSHQTKEIPFSKTKF